MASARRESAFDAAVRLLSSRERTAGALGARLETKGYDADEIAAALARAQELGYLDEGRTARALVAHWAERGGSRAFIALKLRVAAVTEAAAEAALAALPSDRDLLRRAVARAPTGLSSARLARRLLSRGFTEELIADVIDAPPDES